MTIQDLLLQEIATTSEPILAKAYHYLRYLKSEEAADRFDGLNASHSALIKDWDSPAEDTGWATQ